MGTDVSFTLHKRLKEWDKKTFSSLILAFICKVDFSPLQPFKTLTVTDLMINTIRPSVVQALYNSKDQARTQMEKCLHGKTNGELLFLESSFKGTRHSREKTQSNRETLKDKDRSTQRAEWEEWNRKIEAGGNGETRNAAGFHKASKYTGTDGAAVPV